MGRGKGKGEGVVCAVECWLVTFATRLRRSYFCVGACACVKRSQYNRCIHTLTVTQSSSLRSCAFACTGCADCFLLTALLVHAHAGTAVLTCCMILEALEWYARRKALPVHGRKAWWCVVCGVWCRHQQCNEERMSAYTRTGKVQLPRAWHWNHHLKHIHGGVIRTSASNCRCSPATCTALSATAPLDPLPPLAQCNTPSSSVGDIISIVIVIVIVSISISISIIVIDIENVRKYARSSGRAV